MLQTLNIEPKSYMELIYKLTDDLTTTDEEPRVHTIMSSKFIRTIQVLTEYGICYTTNNIIAANLTTKWGLEFMSASFIDGANYSFFRILQLVIETGTEQTKSTSNAGSNVWCPIRQFIWWWSDLFRPWIQDPYYSKYNRCLIILWEYKTN